MERLAACGVPVVISHGAHDYKKHWATQFFTQKRVFLFSAGPKAAASRFVRFSLAPLWQRLAGFNLEAGEAG
jgi:hypothetical protein